MADVRPYVILVALDFSELGERALERALEIANTRPGVRVHAVTVVAGDGLGRLEFGAYGNRITVQKEKAQLDDHVDGILARSRRPEWVEKIQNPKMVNVTRHVLCGAPVDEIVGLGKKYEADLIVVGTHGRRGVSRLLLGSVAEGVLRNAQCPVLVVREKKWE